MPEIFIEISEDEFDNRYQLLENHINPNASWAYGDRPGCLFESFGDELNFVNQQPPFIREALAAKLLSIAPDKPKLLELSVELKEGKCELSIFT